MRHGGDGGCLAAVLRDDLAAALALAALSPSSHNSQPWEVLVVGSEARRMELRHWLGGGEPEEAWLWVALNHDRCLKALPAFDLEMNLSCGAYLESLWLGFEAQGRETQIAWRQGEDGGLPPLPVPWPGNWRPVALIRVGSKRLSEPVPAALAKVAELRKRITNRGPYAAVAGGTTEAVAAFGSAAFAEANGAFEMVVLQDPATLSRLGAFVAATASMEFEDAAAWEETYRHIRFGGEMGSDGATGLPASQLFGPLPSWALPLLRRLLAPSSMGLLKRLGFCGLLARQLGALVGAAPLAVVLAFKDENPSPALQLAGGGWLLGLWLAAARAGLALHPISVVLQHPRLRQRLQDEFGLPGRVFFLARAGIPSQQFPPAPKRSPVWDDIAVI